MKCDPLPPRVVARKFRQNFDYGLLQPENSSLIEQHAGRGGGYNLGDGSQVINCLGGDEGGIRVISKSSDPFQCNKFAPMGYSNRCPWKCLLCNTGFQHLKGASEVLILAGKILGKHGVG